MNIMYVTHHFEVAELEGLLTQVPLFALAHPVVLSGVSVHMYIYVHSSVFIYMHVYIFL